MIFPKYYNLDSLRCFSVGLNRVTTIWLVAPHAFRWSTEQYTCPNGWKARQIRPIRFETSQQSIPFLSETVATRRKSSLFQSDSKTPNSGRLIDRSLIRLQLLSFRFPRRFGYASGRTMSGQRLRLQRHSVRLLSWVPLQFEQQQLQSLRREDSECGAEQRRRL